MDSGYAGFSYSNYNNDYGVPGEHAESDTLIEMERDRFEFRTEIEITDSEWLRAVELNLGYADYKHSESGYETEDNVTEWHTHSTYLKEGFDAKIAFDHEFGDFSGVFGFTVFLMNSKLKAKKVFLVVSVRMITIIQFLKMMQSVQRILLG